MEVLYFIFGFVLGGLFLFCVARKKSSTKNVGTLKYVIDSDGLYFVLDLDVIPEAVIREKQIILKVDEEMIYASQK